MITLSDAAYNSLNREAERSIEFGVCLKFIRAELDSDHDDATKIFWIERTMLLHKREVDAFINNKEPEYDTDESAE